jgi:TRAP-type uncharacterized transport system substrate-binding protein
MKKFYLLSAAIVVAASPAFGQSLSARLAAKNKVKTVDIQVACGKLDKSNCAQVLPRLAEYTVPNNVNLKAIESSGSVESADGLCEGLVDAAIGQRDAFDLVQRKCVGKFETVGKGIYPYFGFFVVRADASFSTFDDMLSSTPEGKSRNVAAGKNGSGGQVTMANILKGYPEAKRAIAVKDYDEATALDRLKGGTLDGYFVMDGPGSDLIEKIKTSVDAKGKPLYKFLDMRLGSRFYSGTLGWNKTPLYQEVLISGGFFSHNYYTVSVDAVAIVSKSFWEDESKGGPAAVRALDSAIDASEGAVSGDVKTPRNWKPLASK